MCGVSDVKLKVIAFPENYFLSLAASLLPRATSLKPVGGWSRAHRAEGVPSERVGSHFIKAHISKVTFGVRPRDGFDAKKVDSGYIVESITWRDFRRSGAATVLSAVQAPARAPGT